MLNVSSHTARPCRPQPAGQSLLEVLIATLLLGLIVWGSSSLFRVSGRQDKVAIARAAGRGYEEEIRAVVASRMKDFVDDTARNQVKNGQGHGEAQGSGHGPGGHCKVHETDLADYLNIDLPSGLSLRLVRQTSGTIASHIAEYWPPAQYPGAQSDNNVVEAFKRCYTNMITVSGNNVNLMNSNWITFCVAAFPTNGPDGNQSSLTSMMPLFGYFTYYNYFPGKVTPGTPPVARAATVLDCKGYRRYAYDDPGPPPGFPALPAAPVPPDRPIMGYLYYTLFWKAHDPSGDIFANFSGMTMRGFP